MVGEAAAVLKTAALILPSPDATAVRSVRRGAVPLLRMARAYAAPPVFSTVSERSSASLAVLTVPVMFDPAPAAVILVASWPAPSMSTYGIIHTLSVYTPGATHTR